MRSQPIDPYSGGITGGTVQIDKTVGEPKFGRKFKKFEKLFETNTVFNRQIHRARTESASALKLFPAHVRFDTESATRQ